MNTRRTRPASAVTLTVLTAAALACAGASPAAADPPALDRDPCATVLSRAAVWPGTMTVGGRTVRLHSDAYDSWLSRQAPCAPPTTEDCHYGPPSIIRAC